MILKLPDGQSQFISLLFDGFILTTIGLDSTAFTCKIRYTSLQIMKMATQTVEITDLNQTYKTLSDWLKATVQGNHHFYDVNE